MRDNILCHVVTFCSSPYTVSGLGGGGGGGGGLLSVAAPLQMHPPVREAQLRPPTFVPDPPDEQLVSMGAHRR